ncbi:MAG: hypothetical protein UW02_C0033G0013, partial [Candidatus Nomurabacteria bacterium GW2011_GWB1_43_7]
IDVDDNGNVLTGGYFYGIMDFDPGAGTANIESADDGYGNYSYDIFISQLTPDVVSPTVSTFSPTDNATGVSITSNLVLTFDETVDVETGNIVIYQSNGSVFETVDVTSGNVTGTGTTTITINPTGTFDDDTEYYVKIDTTAFDDLSGNSYAGIASETTWNFTVEDLSNPTVSDYFPSDGATQVDTRPELILTFDEAVDVETGNIVIYRSDDVVLETIGVTSSKVTGTGTTTITINHFLTLNVAQSRLGVGTSTPYGLLSLFVASSTYSTNTLFSLSSSTSSFFRSRRFSDCLPLRPYI